jgi:hypothetical protein
MGNKISTILAVLLLLITLQGSAFYFIRLRVKFIEWLFFNPCSISNVVFLIGFFLFLFKGDRTLLHFPILPMFFFGTLGMLFLPWDGMNIIPQIGHVVMTLNVMLTLYATYAASDFKAAAVGFAIGIAIFAPFIAFQQMYVRNHPHDFHRILVNARPME